MNVVVDIVSQYSLSFGPAAMLAAAGLFTRLSAIAFFLPGLGERSVPIRVRLAAAAAFAIVLFPIALDVTPKEVPTNVSGFVIVLCAEAANGLLIGFATRIFVFILQLAGAMVAQNLSLSQLFGPTVGFESESPFATILVTAGLGVAMATGLHFHLAGAIGASFEVLNFGVFPGGEATGEWTTARTGLAFMKALSLAAPFVILGFIYSIALSAASRAMPQLPAAFVGAPMITFAGLALFAAATPVILINWLAAFQNATFDLFGSAL